MKVIRGRLNAKKQLRPSGHRSVELHFGLCLQQKCPKGGGVPQEVYQEVNFGILVVFSVGREISSSVDLE
jgi:hypothetical protein